MKYLKMLGLAAVAAMALTAFAASASATELYSGSTTQGVGTKIEATLKGESSALLKDTLGGANDTCTSSEVKGEIENAGSASTHPSGNIGTLSFGGCSHTTTVLANGSLEIRHIASTTNGTVISKGARVTVKSTIFGISCVAATKEGTTIGTLTGVTSGNATMDINGVITLENGCGDSTWTGTYLVTSPSGLNVEAS